MKIKSFLERNGIILEIDCIDFNDELFFKFRFKMKDIIHFKKLTKLSEVIAVYNENKKYGVATPLSKYINLYGEEEGGKRFNAKKPCGVTLHKMIEKYGKEDGTKRFDSYRKKQAYTNTKEYLGDRYEEVNIRKGQTLKSYIIKYGTEELALQKLSIFYSKVKFYSKTSQLLFNEVEKFLTDDERTHSYYATKNKEYCVHTIDRTYMYDYVCTSLKLCIEYHGDHYHGNPKIYGPNDKLKGKGQSNRTAKTAWNEDYIKESVIREKRLYDYVTVWENDYLLNPDQVLQKIKRVIDERRLQFNR